MSTTDNQPETEITRPPVVVVLGHVDHGKTSILDKIRQTKVTEKEAGGITQHVGAYQAEHQGKTITFLDTPGHEAFSAIRSRGAKGADIAILVVAAGEGVKPQTKEAIQIIKEADIPFVVAINKIDSASANVQNAKQMLAENEVLVEGYGGKIPVVELSAKTGVGIDSLLEVILLLAEMEELKARPKGQAEGIVIEAHLDSKRGIRVTLLVFEGELMLSHWIAAGTATGKIKSMEDFNATQIKVAIPSQPAVVFGWNQAPKVGEEFKSFTIQKDAESHAISKAGSDPVALFLKEIGSDKSNIKTVNFIIKADTQGALEAIEQAMKAIHSEEVEYRVIGHGVGRINDGDVKNAIAGSAFIVGFNVPIDGSALNLAERNGVKIEEFKIIYELIEKIRSVMSDHLDPEVKRTDLGRIKILALFKKEVRSQVVGGKVTKGKAVRGALVEIVRNGKILMLGRLGQLQHNKADVAEVSEGLECGIRFDLLKDTKQTIPVFIKEGDALEIYEEEKIKRSL